VSRFFDGFTRCPLYPAAAGASPGMPLPSGLKNQVFFISERQKKLFGARFARAIQNRTTK
jgi:hypothetical protein